MIARESRILVESGRISHFGVVGIAATLVYIAATMFADEDLALAPIIGAIIGQAASTAVSYFGHLLYSFRVKSDHRVFFGRFVLISLLVLSLNVGVSWALTDFLGASHRMAILVVAILILIMNYLSNRFWVFLPGFRKAVSLVSATGERLSSKGGA
jgi:putative flippase GtrA